MIVGFGHWAIPKQNMKIIMPGGSLAFVVVLAKQKKTSAGPRAGGGGRDRRRRREEKTCVLEDLSRQNLNSECQEARDHRSKTLSSLFSFSLSLQSKKYFCIVPTWRRGAGRGKDVRNNVRLHNNNMTSPDAAHAHREEPRKRMHIHDA